MYLVENLGHIYDNFYKLLMIALNYQQYCFEYTTSKLCEKPLDKGLNRKTLPPNDFSIIEASTDMTRCK